MASLTSLVTRHIFGVNSEVVDNICYTDDETLTYVAGHTMVLYSEAEKRQRFIPTNEIAELITAFAAGSGRRLVAVAERGERPQIHVYDLRTFRRKKTLTAPDNTNAKEFVCIQFSEDDENMLSLTGAPDWTLTCWNWNKAKIIAEAQISVSAPIYRCSFCPVESSIVCAVGKDCVKFFRVVDKEIRILQDNHHNDHDFTASCWLRKPDDHLLAGTSDGRLKVFHSGDALFDLSCSPGENYPIHCLLNIENGFLAGSVNGTVLVFMITGGLSKLNKNSVQLVQTVTSDLSSGSILAFSLSPKEKKICALTSDSQLLKISASDLPQLSAEQITYAVSSFHSSKPITGMDICTRKPIFVTCGKDNTLRIWNIQTHELELRETFPEDMFSVALHPTGMHVAVGFTDKVRIYHVLVDSLRPCLELPIKACRECSFSKGGHMLACANGNVISVYEFYSGDKVCDLRGHGSKVRSIHWLDSGYQLITCGQDGFVYMWELEGSRRLPFEFIHKGTMFTSVVRDGESVFLVGNDRNLRELQMPELTLKKELQAGVTLTQLALSIARSSLFAGTGEHGKPGHVRLYNYPVTGEAEEYPCMGSAVSRLCLTPDENLLVVADETGCIALFELKDRQERFQRNPAVLPDLVTVENWCDEVLVTKNELEEKSSQVTELHTKVDELRLHNDYQLKLKEMNYSEKIKEVTDKFVQELEQAKTKLELLIEEKNDANVEYLERSRVVEEKHQHEVQEIETGYQMKIMELVDAFQQLIRERDAQIERLEDHRRQLVVSHERYVEELTQDFEQKLDEERQTRLRLEEEKHEVHKELSETQFQLEDDVDTEIENLRRTFEDKLMTSRETTLKFKGENGIMKKKYGVMQKELEEQKEEMRALQEKERSLHDQIKLLEKEVSAHKKEIKTRDASINEKEKRIYELKKKNQELDKFKFVLDYKIRELKQQVEPRQQEIMKMRDHIKDMDSELEKYHKSNGSLDEMIGVLRGRIDSLQEENKSTRIAAKHQENAIEGFCGDVQMAIVHILDPPQLRTVAVKLVEAHGSHGDTKPRIDPDVESEYNRHKDFLKKTMGQLKKSLEGGTGAHMETNNQMMQQNMSLIDEINKQRENNRSLKQHVQAEMGKLRHLFQNINIAQRTAAGKKSRGGGENKDSDIEGAGAPRNILTGGRGASYGNKDKKPDAEEAAELSDQLYRNRQRILALRAAIAELEGRRLNQRSFSREMLPPIDGIGAADERLQALSLQGQGI